ncbi:phosphoribosyltransferase [Methylocapsa palsarum]|uniref:Predicted phosphoribosyltransferase n=1 Tax=Methylocapsa palsarum TaxID=1612308 RepID=A0A1I3YF12_9HYPH|nr:phosphoribosyltransferase [Methylocapsa palsarum]SFK29969.1 Predicted phosphoribosyltransferase [Methylocapsa palsarum]
MFVDRSDAGRQLASLLAPLKAQHPIVFALPRGGAPVAAEIAKALRAPLDLLLVRKLGAPSQPELAIGAIVDGAKPTLLLNDEIVRSLHVTPGEIAQIRDVELGVIERRRKSYFKGRPPLSAKGRFVIVVDDGLATGATARAALNALRQQGASRIALAVPVAPPQTLQDLALECDEIYCLQEQDYFPGVGAFYRDFRQLTDAEVIAILDSLDQNGVPA